LTNHGIQPGNVILDHRVDSNPQLQIIYMKEWRRTNDPTKSSEKVVILIFFGSFAENNLKDPTS
jgi:hypothetical protein